MTFKKLLLACPPKKVYMCFLVLEKRSQTLGAIFARIFRDFDQSFDKSKLLGMRLHPLHPRLLHH